MTVHNCGAPIADERLLEYWLGEVGGVEESALDEHLLSCDSCSERLRKLAELGAGVRAIVARGGVQAVITDGLLECLARAGLQIREYSVFPNGSVNCTVAPDDDLLVSRLHAPLAGVERLDLVLVDILSAGEQRLASIPFNPASQSVLLAPPLDDVRKRPAHTARMRLIAVSAAGDQVLGEYVFNHSPWRESPHAG